MLVISGAQSGVDQAALFVATKKGFEVGGWCPLGGKDENNQDMRRFYPTLRETKTSNPDERTKLNIRDSDGTVIIVPDDPLPKNIKDGTQLTIDEAKRLGKPCLIINLKAQNNHADDIREWIYHNNIEVLNIAGPRESNAPGINKAASEIFEALFSSLQMRPGF